ncbi:hypothetical protein [uncultured Ramlibacter sp.]|uniref:hypothetical protein n=1 Tax=uncultured Ramlibacter sp. TaxID=260755 RepID=UPI00261573E4|nr:hypothetical protein [uncultured Ramlibacter sp.]
MADSDRTASLMTPAKLAQVSRPKAAVSPAAYLDRMAADAGHMHLHQLAQLRGVLETHARARDPAPIAKELAQLAKTLSDLDFALLEARGWWARTTGKGRSTSGEFAAQVEQIDATAQALALQVQKLHKRQQAEAVATERTLVEFEVECRAIDKLVEQGARWLQDMRKQLQERSAAATGEQSQQQLREDAGRCDILIARLKLLRDVVAAAQAVHEQARGTAAQRATVLQMLQQVLASDVKAWQGRMPALAAQAAQGKPPSLEGAMETHQELQLCIRQCIADGETLRAQEDALAAALAGFGRLLDAAG